MNTKIKSALGALFILVSLASSYGREVTIDTTFAKDEQGKPPVVEPSGFPLEHPSSIELSKHSSIKVLVRISLQPGARLDPATTVSGRLLCAFGALAPRGKLPTLATSKAPSAWKN